MMKISKLMAVAVVASACSILFSPLLASASGMHKKVMVEQAWARASTGKVAGAFMTLKNQTDADDVLLSASSDVAKRVEIHTTKTVDGIMKMTQMTDGVPLAGNGMVMFKPGSYHVMLMGLNRPLNEGDTFTVHLTFKNAGDIETVVTVQKAGAMGAMKHDHEHKMDDKKEKSHKHND